MHMKTSTIYNFNAGPAMLPVAVIQKAQEEFLDYQGTGMSIMEMSHRGSVFQNVLDTAESDLRELIGIPKDYSVVFCPGGATLQFSAVALNLLNAEETASYSLTGVWSVKAFKEAKKFANLVTNIFDGEKTSFRTIPDIKESDLHPASRFLYLTSNNTIYGTRYAKFPDVSIPIVADMTSELLSRQIDINRFGVIFAGAQKNIGPSGLTVLIVRNDLLREMRHPIPVLLDWKILAKNQSLYNTPPTYSIYIAGLVFSWLKELGGIAAIEKINEEKANKLYTYLDSSGFYEVPITQPYRSTMNVVFHLKNKDLEKNFVEESENFGLFGLQGHRDAGGMRASIYNAMPIEGVDQLIEFLKGFEKKWG
ncbi:3-phosphoserine/phosphohydroxythreonine transaminase [Leptospira sp. GIMC2001]|uniref:3-phosphoserine/phosphohydroxythreonine transaminase n=1 Tax=Leptospira sp. GIMC2001 TaxID=1513297 RepID=UPI00234B9BA8|nr:3-phosphoserine/phosphohydroxythreonine transaminase [Leptospira sp. GIMC2001]WCL48437.1 3-phosphoserine/phosphohydroxythreonine transaminase [Leptospira sp. GIMC2001]